MIKQKLTVTITKKILITRITLDDKTDSEINSGTRPHNLS